MEQRTNRYEPIKPIDIVSIVMLAAIAAFFAGYIYSYLFPEKQNVFDEIYYEVRAEKHGLNTVLTTGTKSAYADYDFGSFMGIQIPAQHMYLAIKGHTLYISFFNSDSDKDWSSIRYTYNVKEKRLYGERSPDFLVDNFLRSYFSWCANAHQFNPYFQGTLGEYEFVFQENVY